jgi:hypothetical protein
VLLLRGDCCVRRAALRWRELKFGTLNAESRDYANIELHTCDHRPCKLILCPNYFSRSLARVLLDPTIGAGTPFAHPTPKSGLTAARVEDVLRSTRRDARRLDATIELVQELADLSGTLIGDELEQVLSLDQLLESIPGFPDYDDAVGGGGGGGGGYASLSQSELRTGIKALCGFADQYGSGLLNLTESVTGSGGSRGALTRLADSLADVAGVDRRANASTTDTTDGRSVLNLLAASVVPFLQARCCLTFFGVGGVTASAARTRARMLRGLTDFSSCPRVQPGLVRLGWGGARAPLCANG